MIWWWWWFGWMVIAVWMSSRGIWFLWFSFQCFGPTFDFCFGWWVVMAARCGYFRNARLSYFFFSKVGSGSKGCVFISFSWDLLFWKTCHWLTILWDGAWWHITWKLTFRKNKNNKFGKCSSFWCFLVKKMVRILSRNQTLHFQYHFWRF